MKAFVLLAAFLLTSCNMTPEQWGAFAQGMSQGASQHSFQQQQLDLQRQSLQQQENNSFRNHLQNVSNTQYYPSLNTPKPAPAKVYGYSNGLRDFSPSYSIEY